MALDLFGNACRDCDYLFTVVTLAEGGIMAGREFLVEIKRTDIALVSTTVNLENY